MGWQTASGCNRRALAEATIGRFKRVIGDGLHSRTDQRQATEMNVAVMVLNRMLELGRPKSVRIALTQARGGPLCPPADPCNTVAQRDTSARAPGLSCPSHARGSRVAPRTAPEPTPCSIPLATHDRRS